MAGARIPIEVQANVLGQTCDGDLFNKFSLRSVKILDITNEWSLAQSQRAAVQMRLLE